jgi:DNA-binding transcriptional LysR family regulator
MKSINLAAIDLNLLVAFEALLEERSVTKAAERLQIGQPAMSASLNRLRVLFEDELFVRLGRQMQPTLKAQAIAPGIVAALHQIRQTITTSHSNSHYGNFARIWLRLLRIFAIDLLEKPMLSFKIS